MKTTVLAPILAMAMIAPAAPAQDRAERVELESIIIKGNREFPQILYIVPWKDMKAEGHREQTLVLHSLFGNLFEPVYAEAIDAPATATPPSVERPVVVPARR